MGRLMKGAEKFTIILLAASSCAPLHREANHRGLVRRQGVEVERLSVGYLNYFSSIMRRGEKRGQLLFHRKTPSPISRRSDPYSCCCAARVRETKFR